MNRKYQRLIILILVFAPVLINGQDIFNKVRKCESIVYKNRYNAFDSILIYAEEQLELAKQMDDSLELGRAHLSLAYANYNLDYNGECLSNLLESRRIFKLIGHGSLYAISTLEMASMFREGSSDYFKPDSLLHNSISFFESHNMNTHLSRAYLELGLNFRNRYRYNIGRDSIMYYYEKAAIYAERGRNLEL